MKELQWVQFSLGVWNEFGIFNFWAQFYQDLVIFTKSKVSGPLYGALERSFQSQAELIVIETPLKPDSMTLTYF